MWFYEWRLEVSQVWTGLSWVPESRVEACQEQFVTDWSRVTPGEFVAGLIGRDGKESIEGCGNTVGQGALYALKNFKDFLLACKLASSMLTSWCKLTSQACCKPNTCYEHSWKNQLKVVVIQLDKVHYYPLQNCIIACKLAGSMLTSWCKLTSQACCEHSWKNQLKVVVIQLDKVHYIPCKILRIFSWLAS